jgi:hypothetical protein
MSSDEEIDSDPAARFVVVDDLDTLSVALDTLSEYKVDTISLDAEGGPRIPTAFTHRAVLTSCCNFPPSAGCRCMLVPMALQICIQSSICMCTLFPEHGLCGAFRCAGPWLSRRESHGPARKTRGIDLFVGRATHTLNITLPRVVG